jgi:hypothetical protein
MLKRRERVALGAAESAGMPEPTKAPLLPKGVMACRGEEGVIAVSRQPIQQFFCVDVPRSMPRTHSLLNDPPTLPAR